MVMAKEKINVRGTLTAMNVGDVWTVRMSDVRGTSLRQCASTLRELGYGFRVNKEGENYNVKREL